MTTTTCPRWCNNHHAPGFEGDAGSHKSAPLWRDGGPGRPDLGVYLIQDVDDDEVPELVIQDSGDVFIAFGDVRWLINAMQEVVDRATPATSTAVETLRMVGERTELFSADDLAAQLGIDLDDATMHDLIRVGRALGEGLGIRASAGGA